MVNLNLWQMFINIHQRLTYMDKKLKDSLMKFALQNGVKFDTVNAGAVISKVIGEHYEAKNNMKEISLELQKIIKEVNSEEPPYDIKGSGTPVRGMRATIEPRLTET